MKEAPSSMPLTCSADKCQAEAFAKLSSVSILSGVLATGEPMLMDNLSTQAAALDLLAVRRETAASVERSWNVVVDKPPL